MLAFEFEQIRFKEKVILQTQKRPYVTFEVKLYF